MIVVGTVACNRSAPDANPTRKEGSAVTPQVSHAAAPPREVEVTGANFTARVRVALPAAWQLSPNGIVLRDASQEAIAGVEFTPICEAACEPDQITSVLDGTLERRGRPNLNTGDPALDAVRLHLEILERRDLPDGKLAVARVTKPAGLEGPYREQLYAVCVRAKPGGRVVAAQAWAPLDREAELRTVLVDACTRFEIL